MQLVKQCFFFFTITFGITSLYAQESKTLALEDLSAFKPQAGNWQIVGDVTMNPNIDIHPPQVQAPVEIKKKSKKTKEQPAPEHPIAVTYTMGKGILLNMNNEVKKDNLITSFEHGDIELELEVMLPKGSNSGIYLQGRYEVQLLDSWGVIDPSYADIGGIYRNWETEKGKIYMGKAPISNPAKAPGLWQKFKISFRAPRFNGAGEKIENAKFISVELNGVKIHDHVEVPLPTGGPIENNEKSTGPLMIQGDHGPVAFRNVKYRLMKDVQASLSNISYKVYYGDFKVISDYTARKPEASGLLPELTCEVTENEDGYGLIYTGDLTVSEDATYEFILARTGGARLVINQQQLVNLQSGDAWGYEPATITLKAGTYPFEIYNFKNASWLPPALGLFVKSPSSAQKPLHAYNSLPPDSDPVSPILIEPGNSPRMLRAFLDFKGDNTQRLTHTIGVGDPNGTHYVYDLKSGNLVCVWHGKFVDATPMWHDRGDGSFKPQGAVQYLFNNEPLSFLTTLQEAFPIMLRETQVSNTPYKGKGYSVEEGTGRPVFSYTYEGIEAEDKIYPDDNDRIITHEVVIKNRGTKTGLYYKLAEGSSINALPDGLFAIDDKQFYIKVGTGIQPTIREVNGKKELITTIDNAIKYSIIW